MPALQAAPIYLLGSDTDILIGAPAGAASIKERIRSWSVKYEQEIIPHRAPGGGKVSTFTKVMKQRASFQLVIAAKDVDDVRTLFVNDTIQELQINTNSGAAAQLNMKFPGAYVTAAQIGVDGNEEIWSIESNQDAGVIKNGAANYVEYVVLNSEPRSSLSARNLKDRAGADSARSTQDRCDSRRSCRATSLKHAGCRSTRPADGESCSPPVPRILSG
jgi:hypothetical protein